MNSLAEGALWGRSEVALVTVQQKHRSLLKSQDDV